MEGVELGVNVDIHLDFVNSDSPDWFLSLRRQSSSKIEATSVPRGFLVWAHMNLSSGTQEVWPRIPSDWSSLFISSLCFAGYKTQVTPAQQWVNTIAHKTPCQWKTS